MEKDWGFCFDYNGHRTKIYTEDIYTAISTAGLHLSVLTRSEEGQERLRACIQKREHFTFTTHDGQEVTFYMSPFDFAITTKRKRETEMVPAIHVNLLTFMSEETKNLFGYGYILSEEKDKELHVVAVAGGPITQEQLQKRFDIRVAVDVDASLLELLALEACLKTCRSVLVDGRILCVHFEHILPVWIRDQITVADAHCSWRPDYVLREKLRPDFEGRRVYGRKIGPLGFPQAKPVSSGYEDVVRGKWWVDTTAAYLETLKTEDKE